MVIGAHTDQLVESSPYSSPLQGAAYMAIQQLAPTPPPTFFPSVTPTLSPTFAPSFTPTFAPSPAPVPTVPTAPSMAPTMSPLPSGNKLRMRRTLNAMVGEWQLFDFETTYVSMVLHCTPQYNPDLASPMVVRVANVSDAEGTALVKLQHAASDPYSMPSNAGPL